eukprot:TRINITY_DN9002_c0_g1_i1.p1 TRINITY_DN9002_c0_g1~~TRINITY_DN9002_c0_g1_i1.p1  ORF type:complete len:352 (-),score=54.50 TRINITY_DN9002_c0_g1_i1:144-1199(-)
MTTSERNTRIILDIVDPYLDRDERVLFLFLSKFYYDFFCRKTVSIKVYDCPWDVQNSLRNFPFLKKLDLNNSSFIDDDIVDEITYDFVGLRSLDLSGLDHITKNCIIYLSRLSNLTKLDTSCSNLKLCDPEFEILSRFTSLVKLSLGFCWNVSDHGIRSLTALTNLKYLGVTCDTTDESFKALLKMTTLEHIYFECANITDAGIEHISRLTALTKFSVVSFDITDTGVSSIAKIPSLKKLDLWGMRNTINLQLLPLTLESFSTGHCEDIRNYDYCVKMRNLKSFDRFNSSQAPISSLSKLEKMDQVKKLSMTHPSETALKKISFLTQLTKLNMRCGSFSEEAMNFVCRGRI